MTGAGLAPSREEHESVSHPPLLAGLYTVMEVGIVRRNIVQTRTRILLLLVLRTELSRSTDLQLIAQRHGVRWSVGRVVGVGSKQVTTWERR
jgi:hypothetical protein